MLTDAHVMIRRMIGEDIDFRLALALKPCGIRIDRSQLDQIVLNLCLNARDAMPKGGRLTVTTDHVTDPLWLDGTGRYVCLRVEDTGEGIDAQTAERCFEPFFTTKEVGRGTGMGLATAYGIIKQAGGDVCVESTPGEGTRFLVCLPAVDSGAPAAVDEIRQKSPGGKGETILLVEDQAEVRRVVLRILERNGYVVIPAASGNEATNMDLRHVDLLLTDVVMPGLSGPELAASLKSAYPHIAVVYMSGYADGATAHHDQNSDAPMLEKPFSDQVLLATLRQVLRKRPGAHLKASRPGARLRNGVRRFRSHAPSRPGSGSSKSTEARGPDDPDPRDNR